MNKLIIKIDKQAVSYRTLEAERHGCFSHCCSVLAVSRSMAETPCKQFDKNRHSDVLLIFFFFPMYLVLLACDFVFLVFLRGHFLTCYYLVIVIVLFAWASLCLNVLL